MVSGITDQIAPELRRHIIISHCSGAEVWGFDSQGALQEQPYYSHYEDIFTPGMRET